jgi:hypothetical protein
LRWLRKGVESKCRFIDVKMFQGSQISRYFSRVGSGKLGVSGVSSSSVVERSDNFYNFGAPMNTPANGFEGTPIEVNKETILESQIRFVGSIRLYPTRNP